MDLNKMFKKTSIRRPSSRFVEEGNKPEAAKGLL